ncbi:hypothetical protein GCM10009844_27360 [Nocardioides koreensis]|uniref:Uncharacterized protein n=1 Tax=Nocardioides koreensis TaxID=433651 RepID=A0ABP5LJY0_9ACTN
MRVVPGLAAVAALASLAGACTAVQESLSCPGESCPAALRAVGDEARQVPRVTSVERAWRFYNVDHGASGGVDVHASVRTESEARRVAAALSTIYQDSGVEPVDRVDVVVVPEPERGRRDDTESVTSGAASSSGAVPCADDDCAAEVAAFRAAFADAPVADEATLDAVSWRADGQDPGTRIEVTATGEPMSPAAFRDFERRIVDVAQAAGLADIGDVRTLVHYRQRVEFSFTFDTQISAGS